MLGSGLNALLISFNNCNQARADDGMQIDQRYVDDQGKPVQGREAYNSSADRMWDLTRMSHAAGLTQIYAGNETEWG
jgi:hypothetical protein